MRSAALLLACLAFLAALPLSAGAPAAPPPCAAVTSPGPADPAGLYLSSEVSSAYVAYEVWREANGVPGLQSRSCVDAGGHVVGADERLARADSRSAPAVPRCLQSVCVI